MPSQTPIFMQLVGANPTASVLTNLTDGSPAVQTAIATALNTSLQAKLSSALAKTPALARLAAGLNPTPAAIANANGLTIQAFLKRELDPLVEAEPVREWAVDEEIGKIRGATTIGSLLQLDTPLQNHPLFATDVTKAGIATLLATSPTMGQDLQLQADFINSYTARTGSIQDFWTALSADPHFANAVPELQLTLQLGTLTSNNAPAVGALRSAYHISTLRDLVTQTNATKLTELITSENIPVPSTIAAGTPAAYAASMMSQLTAAFPTDFVAQSLKTSTDTTNQAVATVLGNAPNLDLRTTNINAYLAANSTTAFQGIASSQIAVVTERLKAVQRLFRVNSDGGTIQALFSSGFDSARKIAATPRAVFLRRSAGLPGGQAAALQTYTTAQQISGMVSNLYQSVTEATQGFNPFVIGNSTAAVQQILAANIPNWQTLFGSTSSCECDECTALDGPAAYFVDLLQFLNSGTQNTVLVGGSPRRGYTPLDVLIGYQNNPNNWTWTANPDGTVTKGSMNLAPDGNPPLGRRPDLAYVQLTCANSDTSLPFVDLVNEILESYVYYVGMLGQVDLPARSKNTAPDATTDQLTANPDNVLSQVYVSSVTPPATKPGPLPTACYPLSLPYDRYLDSARIYLNNLGVTRAQLIEDFTPPSSTTDEQAQLAVEVLNSNQYEYGLITGLDFTGNPITLPQTYSLYGFPAATWPTPPFTIAPPRVTSAAGNWSVTLGGSASNPTLLISGGPPSVGDAVTLSVIIEGVDGSTINLTYTAVSGDTITSIATQLAALIQGNPILQAAGISASLSGTQITINSGTANWEASLAVVQTFLNLTGITIDALVTLLKTQFFNAAQYIVIQPNPSNVCDVTTMVIVELLPLHIRTPGTPLIILGALSAFYANVPAFLRLKARLGWSIWELDKAITAITSIAPPAAGTPQIDRAFVLAVAQIKTLQGLFNLSVTQLLALWANIDADGRNSLYIQLFQNKAVISPLDTAFALRYNASLTSPPQAFVTALTQGTWSDGSAQTQAALGSDVLYFTGTMTESQHDDLLTWASENSATFSATTLNATLLAIDNLYNQRWAQGTDIFSAGQNQSLICYHMNTILAALQVSAADLSAIAVDCGLIPAGADLGAFVSAAIVGTPKNGDTVELTVAYRDANHKLVGTRKFSYTVGLLDTLQSIVAGLAAAINTASFLGITAAVQAGLTNIYVPTSTSAQWTLEWSATANVTITLCPQLGIAHLSQLYRYALLSQALNLSPTELIALKALTGINPFAAGPGGQSKALPLALTQPGELPDSPTNPAVQFVNIAQAVAASKFSIEQLNYLYRAIPDAIDTLPPTLASQQQLLVNLAAGIQKIAAANAFSPDPSGTALRKQLAKLLPAAQVDPTMDLIAGTATYTSTTPLSSIPPVPTRRPGQTPALITLVTIGGVASEGDRVSLTWAGAPPTPPLIHTAASGETAGKIASALCAQITSALGPGISATVAGSVVTITTPFSLNPVGAWSGAVTPSTNATETITVCDAALDKVSFLTDVLLGGSVTPGDVVTLSVALGDSAGSVITLSHHVGDTFAWIAQDLAAQINANTTLSAANIHAGTAANVITVSAPAPTASPVTWTASVSSPNGAPTEELTIVAGAAGAPTSITVGGGAVTPNDTLVLSATIGTANPITVASHTVAGDTLSSIAADLVKQVNNNPTLGAAGISAGMGNGPGGPVVTLATQLLLTPSLTCSATITASAGTPGEKVAMAPGQLSTTVTLNGSAQPGDTVSLLFGSDAFAGSVVNLPSSGASLASIASDLALQINSNPTLSAAGISAPIPSAGSPVITISNVPCLSSSQMWKCSVSPATAGGTTTETLSIAAPVLQCVGPMSDATQANLSNLNLLSGDPAFTAAVCDLYNQALAVLSQNLTFLAPTTTYSTGLLALPSGVTLPLAPPGQVAFVLGFITSHGRHLPANSLVCYGPMSNSTRVHLLALSRDSTFRNAVNTLYQQAWDLPSENVIDVPASSTAAERYDYVLQNLLAYLQLTQSQSLVVQTLSQALSLSSSVVALLLEGGPTPATTALLPSQTGTDAPGITDFLGALLGVYFDQNSQKIRTQIDPGVDLDGSEAPFVSAQWFGQIVPPTTDTYTFYVPVVPGTIQVQLYVDEEKLIDTASPPPNLPAIVLQAGQVYDLQMNCSSVPVHAQIQLQWSNSSIAQTTIPPTALILGAAPSSATGTGSFTPGGVYGTLSLLNRIALLVNGFSMKADELAYLSAHPTDFEGVSPIQGGSTAPFDLSALPLDYYPPSPNQPATNPNQGTIDQNAPALFNQWLRLNSLYNLKAALPSGGNVGLFDIFQAAWTSINAPLSMAASASGTGATSATGTALPAVSQAVANTVLEATSWSASDFRTLAGPSGFSLADGSFVKEIALVRLAACFGLVTRLGAPSQQLLQWATVAPSPSQAQDIQTTVRSKYTDAAWAQVAPSLANQVREHSKDALIAYILTMPPIVAAGFSTADDLYDYFLIDVQMCTCMQTSRLVQASAAVQQFVQRCLLGLEYDATNPNNPLNVSPGAIDANEWENWRKNYRVWQAAVEVFLYPENWIDPTLRDNRTPFFQDLQNQLLQSSVTADNVEAAYLNYLDQLQQVARLEIVGLWVEQAANSTADNPIPAKTHVIGRTYAQPYVYYYRYQQQTNYQYVWSAWEEIDLDIKDSVVIPVVLNGRLFIFWPSLSQVTINTNLGQSAQGQDLYYYLLEIQNSFGPVQDYTGIQILQTYIANLPIANTVISTLAGLLQSMLKNVSSPPNPQPNSDFIVTTTSSGITNYAAGPSFLADWQTFVNTLQTDINTYSPGTTSAANQSPLPPVQSLAIQFAWSEYRSGQWTKRKLSDQLPLPYFSSFQQVTADQFNWQFQKALISPQEQISLFIHNPGTPQSSQTYVLPTFNNSFLYSGTVTGDAINISVYCVYKEIKELVGSPGSTTLGAANQLTVAAFPFDYIDFQEPQEPTSSGPTPWPTSPVDLAVDDNRLDVSGGLFASPLDVEILGTGPESFIQALNPPSTPPGGFPLYTISLTSDQIGLAADYYPNGAGNPPAIGMQLGPVTPFFYTDTGAKRPFFVSLDASSLVSFANHYHPLVDQFIEKLNEGDIPCLLSISTQELTGSLNFSSTYGPATSGVVSSQFPVELVDTSATGAYSIYNWELFFHIPFLIATQLSQNQQFEDAQTWFHYIFNPTNDAAVDSSRNPIAIPLCYWNFLPFRQNPQDGQIQDLVNLLAEPPLTLGLLLLLELYVVLVGEWQNNPFDPDLIAQNRMVAYQKAVVMAYIDNLIAWGDSLFSQNTRESINEATQLYVLADKILGPKPVTVPQEGTVLPKAYSDLQWYGLDNAMVQLENSFPFSLPSTGVTNNSSGSSILNGVGGASTGAVPYFCTPANDQLLGYWDTVANRLYKIRHCMNIQGQVQQLPLFAPPINPALLVAAEAAGVDLSSVLSDVNATVPYYRFSHMIARAQELCAEVKSLGNALLSALEKKDAEALALLRAQQEIAVQNAILTLKQAQLSEANSNLAALNASQAVTAYRQSYYQGLISAGLSGYEQGQIVALTEAQILKTGGQVIQLLAPAADVVPDAIVGAAGAASSPVALTIYGGRNFSAAASDAAQAMTMLADISSFIATMASLMGQWDRRSQDWNFHAQTAGLELNQISQQIAAAQFRIQIAQDDIQNQQLLISNAQAVQDFLTNKFTSGDLYSWMIDQVSALYFQTYQLAYDLARKAEVCFRYELGLAGSSYIQFGYWDNLKQGLLSGEKLYLDLKRLELAYMEQNKREYEITRNISLLLLDPLALIALKETGQCLVSLPEAFFDMDYPGHYMRRIKSLSLTIPCVTGPYVSVNCTLTLVQSKIRWNNNGSGGYAENPAGSDQRFFYNYAATQSIATSTAQNDSGMFQVNFSDERYLPFEGGGAISQWLISMPQECNAFDFETITDVIFNLKYTARDGGAALAGPALKAAVLPGPQPQAGLNSSTASIPRQTNLTRLFSLKHEFPTEWYQFMRPTGSAPQQTMSLPLTKERFPFQYRARNIAVSQVQLFLQFKAVSPESSSTPLAEYGSSALPVTVTPPSGTAPGSLVSSSGVLGGIPWASIPLPSPTPISARPQPWTLSIKQSDIQNLASSLQTASTGYLNPAVIDDIFLVCQYSVQ